MVVSSRVIRVAREAEGGECRVHDDPWRRTGGQLFQVRTVAATILTTESLRIGDRMGIPFSQVSRCSDFPDVHGNFFRVFFFKIHQFLKWMNKRTVMFG